MKRVLIFCIALLFSACKSDYEIYIDQDSRFRQLNDLPEAFIIVKRDAGIYYKVVHFTSDWEFLDGMFEGKVVHDGYYLADGDGFNGYDLQHRHASLDEAMKAAQAAGRIYEFPLGQVYGYQSGSFYRNSPFKKLEKK